MTVRSFKSVIEGFLAAFFAEASANYNEKILSEQAISEEALIGQTVRLEGTIEAPRLLSSETEEMHS